MEYKELIQGAQDSLFSLSVLFEQNLNKGGSHASNSGQREYMYKDSREIMQHSENCKISTENHKVPTENHKRTVRYLWSLREVCASQEMGLDPVRLYR